jgi:hypothetical protein
MHRTVSRVAERSVREVTGEEDQSRNEQRRPDDCHDDQSSGADRRRVRPVVAIAADHEKHGKNDPDDLQQRRFFRWRRSIGLRIARQGRHRDRH